LIIAIKDHYTVVSADEPLLIDELPVKKARKAL
jgi:hypothetical protein